MSRPESKCNIRETVLSDGLYSAMTLIGNTPHGAVRVTQGLKAFAVLPEDLDLSPSTHVVSHTQLSVTAVPGDLASSDH